MGLIPDHPKIATTMTSQCPPHAKTQSCRRRLGLACQSTRGLGTRTGSVGREGGQRPFQVARAAPASGGRLEESMSPGGTSSHTHLMDPTARGSCQGLAHEAGPLLLLPLSQRGLWPGRDLRGRAARRGRGRQDVRMCGSSGPECEAPDTVRNGHL